MKQLTHWLATSVILLIAACSLYPKGYVVEFTILDDFKGLIIVSEDLGYSQNHTEENGQIRLNVPENGLVFVDNIDRFYGYVSHKASYVSGEKLPTVTVEFWYKDPSKILPPSEMEIKAIHPEIDLSQRALIVPNQPEYGKKLYFVGAVSEFKEYFENNQKLYQLEVDR